jgi:hypothetical protein
MAKKKKDSKESTIENYYDLRVDKVDELVEALKSGEPTEAEKNGEELSFNIADCTGEADEGSKKKQFDPYKRDKLSRIPTWIKAIFIKFWFAGAVCYFIIWGLQSYMDYLDSAILSGLVLGIVVDCLVNPLFRFMESDKKEYNAYMMFPFPFKAFWTFFANIIYYLCVTAGLYFCYVGVNLLGNMIAHTEDITYVGIEPILFGLFVLIIDMALIGIKDLIVYLVKKAKPKKVENENV